MDGIAVVDLSGAVAGILGTGAIRNGVRGLIVRGERRLAVNCSGVTSIDSAGLGELVSCYASMTRQNGSMVLAAVPPKLSHLLTITGLRAMLQSFPTEADALAYLAAAPQSQ